MPKRVVPVRVRPWAPESRSLTGTMTIAGAGDNSKSHPACSLLESTRNQAARMLSDFGLTPRGRLGVDIRPAPRENIFGANGDKYFVRKPWDRASDGRRS